MLQHNDRRAIIELALPLRQSATMSAASEWSARITNTTWFAVIRLQETGDFLMELTQYQWEIYLKAGGQKMVDHFQRVINGDRDGFEELIVECLYAFCPDKALIEQCAKGIESVVSFENETGQFSHSISLLMNKATQSLNRMFLSFS